MKSITSKDNSIIKEAAALKEKKYRDRSGLYLVDGPNLVKELMDYGGRPRFIFIKAGADREVCDIAASASEPTAVYELSPEAFEKISCSDNSQGIIAVAVQKKTELKDFIKKTEKSNILVLDRLQDPGNLGTLIRSAEALGFGGIILVKGGADPYQPKVVRAAAGSLNRMPLVWAENGEEAVKLLKESGKRVFSACMKGDVSIFDARLGENVAIVIGNEGNGINKEIMGCSEKLFIPMDGKLESLNAAAAAIIIMYECKRQRL